MYAHLWDRINQLEKQITTLRNEQQVLEKKLAELEPIKIDKIEYKVQELHVETLSGSLDIGLTVKGNEKSIEKLVEKIKDDRSTKFNFGTHQKNKASKLSPIDLQTNPGDD